MPGRLAATIALVFLLLLPLPTSFVAARETQIVRVGVYDNAPLIFMDDSGQAAGLYVDLLTYIAHQEDWALDYVQCTLATCLEALETGALDLLPAMAPRSEENPALQFSSETVATNWGQIITPATRKIKHILELDRQTIAIVQDDWTARDFEHFVIEFNLAVRFIPFSQEADVIQEVVSGGADAGLINHLSLEYHDLHSPVALDSALVLTPIRMLFAAPAGEDGAALLNILDRHLSALKNDQHSPFYRATSRWVHGSRTTLPGWLPGALLAGGSAILIFAAGALVLGQQVQRRTAELEQRTRELQSLLDASRDLAAIRDLRDLLNHIAQHAVDLLDADEAILMEMVDARHLRPILMLGEHTDDLLRVTIPVGQGLSGICVANNEPLIGNNAQDDPRAIQASGTPVAAVEHVMVTPLSFQGKITGALLVNRQNKPEFTPDNLRVLTALARYCSTAMENARLYTELEKYNTSLEILVVERTSDLQAMNENLSRLSSLKDEFISNISHELRTPIASLKLRRYLLARQPEAAATHLDVIERETCRLEQIVEDLLYLSRLDQERISFTPEIMDLNRLVAEMGADRDPLAAERGLRLSIHPTPNLPSILGDPHLLSQVLSNLLTNALNYTPSGGAITLETFNRGVNGQSWVGFSVSDTGPGIAPEDQERIFDRFYRGSTARESGQHGTGLGLSIAQEIIARHGGDITCSSPGSAGQSTTFTVLLPPAAAG